MNRRNQTYRPSARDRLSFTRDRASATQGLYGSKALSRNASSGLRSEWRPILGGNQMVTAEKEHPLSGSYTPPVKTQHEHLPQQTANWAGSHCSRGRGIESRKRRFALQRISLPSDRIPLLQDGVGNSASGRLQGVSIQDVNENLPTNQSGGSAKTSNSKDPERHDRLVQQWITDRSPIRTLSDDIIHVSLRLGTVSEPDAWYINATQSRRPGQRGDLPILGSRGTTANSKKRTVRSPAQGVTGKKRRVTKFQNSPRRRTTATDRATKTASLASSSRAHPRSTIIPATRRSGTDFWSGSKPLP